MLKSDKKIVRQNYRRGEAVLAISFVREERNRAFFARTQKGLHICRYSFTTVGATYIVQR